MNAPWDRLPLVIGDAGAEMLRRFRATVEDAFPGRLRAMVLLGHGRVGTAGRMATGTSRSSSKTSSATARADA